MVEDIQNTAEETQNTAVAEQMVKDAISQFKGADLDDNPSDTEDEKTGSQPERKRPDGYVEVDDPKVKDRIDELWKQVRGSDETNKKLRGHAAQLEGALENALARLEQIENRQYKSDHDRAINTLYAQLQEAKNIGDDRLVIQLEDQLMDIKLEKREMERQRKAETQNIHKLQTQQQQQRTHDYGKEEEDYITDLQRETDKDGNLVRPWLDKNHKDHERAVKLAALHAAEINRANGTNLAPISEVMKRVEAEMNGGRKRPSPATPEVLSGRDLTRTSKEDRVNLNAEQRFIYDRLELKKLGIDEKTHARRAELIARANKNRVSVSDF